MASPVSPDQDVYFLDPQTLQMWYLYSSAFTPCEARDYQLQSPGDPPVLRFPLYVGKQWNASSNKQHYSVSAIETVTVPAGSFESFRVDITGKSGSRERAWTVFYAPEAKAIVKSVGQSFGSHPPGVRGELFEAVRDLVDAELVWYETVERPMRTEAEVLCPDYSNQRQSMLRVPLVEPPGIEPSEWPLDFPGNATFRATRGAYEAEVIWEFDGPHGVERRVGYETTFGVDRPGTYRVTNHLTRGSETGPESQAYVTLDSYGEARIECPGLPTSATTEECQAATFVPGPGAATITLSFAVPVLQGCGHFRVLDEDGMTVLVGSAAGSFDLQLPSHAKDSRPWTIEWKQGRPTGGNVDIAIQVDHAPPDSVVTTGTQVSCTGP